jgi:hypothetical protein
MLQWHLFSHCAFSFKHINQLMTRCVYGFTERGPGVGRAHRHSLFMALRSEGCNCASRFAQWHASQLSAVEGKVIVQVWLFVA